MKHTKKTQTYICSFCGKNQDPVQRLIAGPGGVYVCGECVAMFSSGSGERSQESGHRCSFCGKRQHQVQHLYVGPNRVNICSECIALCQEIIEEEKQSSREP